MRCLQLSSNNFCATRDRIRRRMLLIRPWSVAVVDWELQADGIDGWSAGTAGCRVPVLLLRHRSCWYDRFAALSLQAAHGRPFSLWFLAQPLRSGDGRPDDPAVRRLRARVCGS